MSHRLEGAAIRTFVMAGRARFTVRNAKTGGRFTYRVRISKDRNAAFVSVLTGPDNTTSFSYIGFIRGGRFFYGGPRSFADAEAPSVGAFGWFWRHIDRLPPAFEVWHEGACGRCGRALTVPESIASGIGPECARRVAA